MSFDAYDRDSLTDGWTMAESPAGAWDMPADIPADNVEWLSAIVPGTVAATLRAHSRWSLEAPAPLHGRDFWFRCRLQASGSRVLRCEGLATVCEAFLNGERLFVSTNMFLEHMVDVECRPGADLVLVFRSLNAHLGTLKPKRARWRTNLIPDQRLRAVRTTLLGHMPGWCPPVDVIGPWRPIRLTDPGARPFDQPEIRAALDGSEGRLTVTLPNSANAMLSGAHMRCCGLSAPLALSELGKLTGSLAIPNVERWWPHTHGRPALHDVTVEIGGERHALGRVGFRSVDIGRGPDGRGFGLRINGVDIFARGTVWMPTGFAALPGDRATYTPELERMRDAGLNMVRVSGIAVYESHEFHRLCDELGILVWQDLMFANFDYPVADDALRQSASSEIAAKLVSLSTSPSLAVVCGGSEITQQAAMMGLPPDRWGNALFDDIAPDLVKRFRPDVIFVRSTPDGGAMPFAANAGITHYYGVGAYRRPLSDARQAQVRFAAECLAFAHVPEQPTLDAHLSVPPVHHPAWKARVPRDNSAAWDFEDTRQHYEREIFGIDANALRQEDPGRYLDIARATTAHVVEATIAEWRRPGSPTRGCLVFTHRDPLPGPGWGYIDATGRPKSSWHALARACQPIAVLLADEGVNGLDVHVLNDTASPVTARLDLTALAEGIRPAASGGRAIEIPARGSLSFAATDLFGGFFDTTRAYRFGPAAHDVTHARLTDMDGTVLAEAFHFPLGRSLHRRPGGLTARVEPSDDGYDLMIGASGFIASITIEDAHFLPKDNGFHMVAGERRVALVRLPGAPDAAKPEGRVRGLTALETASYRVK